MLGTIICRPYRWYSSEVKGHFDLVWLWIVRFSVAGEGGLWELGSSILASCAFKFASWVSVEAIWSLRASALWETESMICGFRYCEKFVMFKLKVCNLMVEMEKTDGTSHGVAKGLCA